MNPASWISLQWIESWFFSNDARFNVSVLQLLGMSRCQSLLYLDFSIGNLEFCITEFSNDLAVPVCQIDCLTLYWIFVSCLYRKHRGLQNRVRSFLWTLILQLDKNLKMIVSSAVWSRHYENFIEYLFKQKTSLNLHTFINFSTLVSSSFPFIEMIGNYWPGQ